MIGAILGDIVGSIYEFDNIKTKEFELFDKACSFTDDTVMTVAVAKALMNFDNIDEENVEEFKEIWLNNTAQKSQNLNFQKEQIKNLQRKRKKRKLKLLIINISFVTKFLISIKDKVILALSFFLLYDKIKS